MAVAHADTLAINFETYSTGAVHGQDGWSSTGSVGSGCAVYDVAVVNNIYGIGSFGTKTLRISNAVTSGCFGDQTFSRSLLDEAGETSAAGDGMSGGARQQYFQAEWDFASTVTGSEQPGLSVVASPDRGDGARMSWVQMKDTPGGLEVNFFDYQDMAPFGSGNPADGCDVGDGFVPTTLVTGLSRTVPHKIKVSIEFVDGPRNDIVRGYVDGVLQHTGTSWEDYFRYCELNPTRTVDSLLFRVGGTAAPATAGKGFLIDNLTLFSGPLAAPSEGNPGGPYCSDGIDNDGDSLIDLADPDCQGPAPVGGITEFFTSSDGAGSGSLGTGNSGLIALVLSALTGVLIFAAVVRKRITNR